jgi:hypothetical protein
MFSSEILGPSRANLEARSFCDHLIPRLEAYKREHGGYPEAIPPDWLQSEAVPKLVDRRTFYIGSKDSYWFRFRDPSWFWNDVWGRSSAWPGGEWIQYDGY